MTLPSLMLSLPLLAVAAVLVRLSSPGPVILRQMRIGIDGRPFTLFKFRTMLCGPDDDAVARHVIAQELRGQAAPDAAGLFRPEHNTRITRIGAILRRFSIDELPQLLNVLRGEMSVVGPRPALPWEVELFPPEYRRRHDCAPGITGLWQVSGRNRLDTLQMLQLDVEYVRRSCLALDLYILLCTPAAVLRRHTR